MGSLLELSQRKDLSHENIFGYSNSRLFDGIFGSWVYSQRPYFHWIKNLKLSDLKKDRPSTTPPPTVRAVTPRSGEISGDKFRRQQTGGHRPSFSSFFRQGSLNTEARSGDNLGNPRFQHIDQNLKVP